MIDDIRRYVGPNDTPSRVLSVMRSSRVAELPVLDGRGVVVGVITATELVDMLIQSEYQHHRPDRDPR
ncbi:MAG: CBS domain-containing protein [Jatrophihabitantaceae bacterium]